MKDCLSSALMGPTLIKFRDTSSSTCQFLLILIFVGVTCVTAIFNWDLSCDLGGLCVYEAWAQTDGVCFPYVYIVYTHCMFFAGWTVGENFHGRFCVLRWWCIWLKKRTTFVFDGKGTSSGILSDESDFVHPSVRPCPTVRPTVRPCDRPYVRPCVRTCVLPSVRPSFRPSVRPSVRPFVRPSEKYKIICYSKSCKVN